MAEPSDGEKAREPAPMLISLDELLAVAWQKRLLVVASVIVFAALAATAAYIMTPQYRVQVVMVPVKGDDMRGALSGALGQLGGLASLAGVSLPSGGNKDENIAFLTSRDFLARFVEEEQLLPVLFAKRWDEAQGQWDVDDPEDIPTVSDGVRFLDRRVRSVKEDRRTGIITLSVVWKDREQAARWANLMVERANRDLRARAISDAEASKNYLNGELARTDVVELRQSLYRLIEGQIKTIMLASVRPEYAFRVIDPAVVPEPRDKISPKRLAMIALGALFGGAFALVVIGWQLRRERMRRWRGVAS